MTWDDDGTGAQSAGQCSDRLGPLQRKAVRRIHRRSRLLDQVSDEPRVANVQKKVVLGVPATQMHEFDHPVAEVDLGPGADQLRRRRDDNFGPLFRPLRVDLDEPVQLRRLVLQ